MTVFIVLTFTTTAIAQDDQEKPKAGLNKTTALEKKLAALQGQLDSAYKQIGRGQKDVQELRRREEETLAEIRAMMADVIYLGRQMSDYIVSAQKFSDTVKSAVTPKKTAEPTTHKVKIPAFDDFDSKLGLKWDILNADLSNFSLTGKPGALTITTQDGHFKEANSNYKNLFLIDTPVLEGQDFQITTCLSDFRPLEAYNQAGLICWDDEDNYLEWVYQKMRRRGLNFNAGVEANGPTKYTYIPAEGPFDKLWLRITKRGKSYECSSSVDGKSFTVRAVENWGDGSPRQIGLFATNGSLTHPPGVDASFEFFKVVAVPVKKTETKSPQPKSISQQALRYGIPKANLQIPDDLKLCAEHLRTIYKALKRYDKDKGGLPDLLSDLFPEYLDKEVLICPVHPDSTPPYTPDPKLPCSYGYQYGNQPYGRSKQMTYREFKDAELKYFGRIVPIVRCYAHSQHLNLAFDGRIYTSELSWEWTVMQAETEP
jgi:regulation of enolase protein 1 (concanavalin A-like superfamily)